MRIYLRSAKKLKNRSGISLIETLCALLISACAFFIISGGMVAGTNALETCSVQRDLRVVAAQYERAIRHELRCAGEGDYSEYIEKGSQFLLPERVLILERSEVKIDADITCALCGGTYSVVINLSAGDEKLERCFSVVPLSKVTEARDDNLT